MQFWLTALWYQTDSLGIPHSITRDTILHTWPSTKVIPPFARILEPPQHKVLNSKNTKIQLCRLECLIPVQIYCSCFWKWDRHRHKILWRLWQEKLFLLHFRVWVCLCINARYVFIGQAFTYSTRLVLHRRVVRGSDTWNAFVQWMLLDCVSMFHWMRKERMWSFMFSLTSYPLSAEKISLCQVCRTLSP